MKNLFCTQAIALLAVLATLTGCAPEPETDTSLENVYRIDLWARGNSAISGLMNGRLAAINLEPSNGSAPSSGSELTLQQDGLALSATFRGSENRGRRIELAIYDEARAGGITDRNLRLTEAHCRALVAAITVTLDGDPVVNPQRMAFYRSTTSYGSCVLERRF